MTADTDTGRWWRWLQRSSHDSQRVNDARSSLFDTAPKFSWLRQRSMGRRRLYAEIEGFVGANYDRLNGRNEWPANIVELVTLARRHATHGSVDTGYAILSCAQRIAINELSEAELDSRTIVVCAEGRDPKLSRWRQRAIAELLGPNGTEAMAKSVALGAEPDAPPSSDPAGESDAAGDSSSVSKETKAARLTDATAIRDEGVQREHRINYVHRSRYFWLIAFIVVAASALVVASVIDPLLLDESTDVPGGVTLSPSLWVHVISLGVLGGAVSAGVRLGRTDASGRVPQVSGGTLAIVFRPVFGGAAAIGAVVILAAGLFATLSLTQGAVLAIAFLAGFSERLLDVATARLGAGDEPPSGKDSSEPSAAST